MFFQWLTYIFVILLGAWIGWKFIIKPLLEGHGIEVEPEEEKVIETSYTKKLERLKKEFALKNESAQSAEAGVSMAREIEFLEKRIKTADDKMKDIENVK